MSNNFHLVRKICECGCTEKFHLGQSAAGNEFLFHADTIWNPALRYTMWTNRIIGWLETGAKIVDEYNSMFSYLELLERIKEDSAHKTRIEAEHDEAGRAWMIGEFF